MRILIVSQYFWPESFRINDLAVGLVKKGHEVTVLTGIPNYPFGKFYQGYGLFNNLRQNYFGAKIIRVPVIPRAKGRIVQLVLNYLSFTFSSVFVSLFLNRKKFDLVFFSHSPVAEGIPAVLLKKIRKMPLISYIVDLWPDAISSVGAIKSPFILNGLGKIVRFIYSHCDQILVSSPGFIERIKAMGIDQSKINYWPQWAEDNYQIIPADKNSAESKEMPSGFRIMFAGNIGAAQGFETIIKAADKLKDFSDIHWVILGDGRMKTWVEKEIELRKIKNTVHVLGRRPVESMPRYFALADALLVNLKSDPVFALTLPAKIQSYMACGRPILACLDGEGAKIIQKSGAGISCPAGDYESLAETVLKIYNCSEIERKEMGLKGRAYFEKHFARNILLAQFEKWIHDLNKKEGGSIK